MSKELEQQLEELAEEFRRIAEEPAPLGVVLQINDPYVMIATSSGLLSVTLPKKPKVKPGMCVRLLKDTWQIINTTELLVAGQLHTVARVDAEKQVFIRDQDREKLVINGLDKLPEVGDSVMLDTSNSIILRHLSGATDTFVFHEDVGVKWDDIVGNVEAKRELREAILMPITSSNILKAYGYKVPKGILLYGPPGCGKTMLGKAAASEIATMHKKTGAGGFIYVKGPQLLDPYVGVSEAMIRDLFIKARAFKEKTGMQAVLFIDEADAILGSRGDRTTNGMEKTIVPAFLAEMDGLSDSGALVLLATNRPDTLDSAVTREGRIDRKISVARPTRENTAELAGKLLAKIPVHKDASVKDLAELAAHEFFCGTKQFSMVEYEGGGAQSFNLSDIISGAMVTSAIDIAKTYAWRRDMKTGKAVTGVIPEDVKAAVHDTFTGNQHTDHREAIIDMAGNNTIVNVRKIEHAQAA